MKSATKLYYIQFFLLVQLIGILSCKKMFSQEYKYEIGGMAGMSMYMGDANNNSFFKGWHPAGGLIFRKNSNFRWAIKGNLLFGKVGGSTQGMDNVFPENGQSQFDRNFYELGGQMEFNFLPYSDKFAYLQTSRLSPYLLAGLGFTIAQGENQTFAGLNFPLGVGMKYKLKNRINLGAEYSFRKLFGDGFDAPNKDGFNLNDPYGLGGSSLKNNDWYSIFMFSLTWDFGPNNRKCTNIE